MPLIELEKPKKISFLIYGQPGSGKTWMISSIAKTLKEGEVIALFDFHGGPKTLITSIGKELVNKHFKIFISRTYKELIEDLLFVKKGIDKGVVKWVVIDTISGMQQMLMTEIKQMKVHGKFGAYTIIGSGDKTSLNEWDMNISRVIEICNFVDDLPCNSVFSAHVTDKKESEILLPSLKGKTLADDIAGMCDVVLHLVVETETLPDGTRTAKHVCYSQPVRLGTSFVARDRLGKLEPVIEPDFEYIMNKLNEGNNTPESN